ncbi:MAG TPA: carbamoyltransferase HypF, partial [Planctomycetaceae bacterium]|nr:carbamoyltransferase HypF [Planctomycetaceae bacterium]
TNCGPRLTIITDAPYDRSLTTMAGFAMCAACRAEYEDPRDRRFHAQPLACPACGPRLVLVDAGGRPVVAEDPLRHTCRLLREGRIAAIKGLGGYHLACDAGNATAVLELRRRKHRDEKPFAVMVRDVADAEALCDVSPVERELLESPARPIVLLRQRNVSAIAAAIAPGNPQLGIMLPYTPLHHLLLIESGGTPLVMTSGNRSEEPIACEDGDALQRLAGIADVLLMHDRPIHVRCEDSVVRVARSAAASGLRGRQKSSARLPVGTDCPTAFIRRSRGYAPETIRLPIECPCPILAVGGQLKGTFALGRGREAIVSHHLGDLDDAQAFLAFVKDVALYEELFAIHPEVIAHDLHPEYASTRYANGRVAEAGPALRLEAVQHHHAHLAACMAEHGLHGPVIGVTFDGSGYGLDGAVWGGEFLVGDSAGFERAAHLRCVGLPGGDRAVREPWRMALAHLADAGVSCDPFERRLSRQAGRLVRQMLERGLNTPPTSSAGRLFDAVAALCGVRHSVSYEGQAAMELEWLSAPLIPDGAYPFEVGRSSTPSSGCSDGVELLRDRLRPAAPPESTASTMCSDGVELRPAAPLEIDTRPLVAAIAEDVWRGTDAARVGRRFHSTLVEIIVAVCGRIRDNARLGRVVLSGGVFTNELLSAETSAELDRNGFEVFSHRLVPANDGSLCLGQLAVAAARCGGSRGSPAAED